MSDIQFNCPKCGHNLVVDAAGAGMSVPCPECSEPLIIPGPEEQTSAQVDNASAGVDTVSAVNTATSEPPLDKPMADGQPPRRSSAARGAAHVFWILFKWVAMAACLIGWLINVAVRWIVVLPTLKARLARRYRKIGAQAYRNKIDEENGSEIREQLLAIDHDSQVSGAPPAEGHKSQSGLALFVARGMRRRRMKRLYAMLGKDLAEGEAVSDSLSRHIRCATRTKQGIERIRAARPKIVAAGNFVLGMAMVGLATAAFYFRDDIPRLSIKSTGVAHEALQESDISALGSSEAMSEVAPIVEVLPESIESSDTDILSDQELQQLLKSIGRYCQFYVARRADVEKWPNWVYSGSGAIRENVWEIYNIVSFEPERWQAADPGILVTGPISFEREGQMQMWIRENRQMLIEDKNGFRRNLTVYELSPDADVQKYRRHMAAYQKKEQAIETAKRNEEQAEAAANKKKELAAENARRDEEARKALADAIKYASTVIPDAVKLPRVILSKKLAARGFTTKIHTPQHDTLVTSVERRDWAEVVRLVAGRIENRKDVDLAVRRLTGSERPGGWQYRKEWVTGKRSEVEDRDLYDPEKSWEVTIEISSPSFKLDHRYLRLGNPYPQLYIRALELPADPETLVLITPWGPDKITLQILLNRYTGQTKTDPDWTELAEGNGFLYKMPRGGNILYFMECPEERGSLLDLGFDKIEVELRSLNQKEESGQIDRDELYRAGVKLVTEFYRYISEKVAPSY